MGSRWASPRLRPSLLTGVGLEAARRCAAALRPMDCTCASEGDLGLQLDDVLVGRHARIAGPAGGRCSLHERWSHGQVALSIMLSP